VCLHLEGPQKSKSATYFLVFFMKKCCWPFSLRSSGERRFTPPSTFVHSQCPCGTVLAIAAHRQLTALFIAAPTSVVSLADCAYPSARARNVGESSLLFFPTADAGPLLRIKSRLCPNRSQTRPELVGVTSLQDARTAPGSPTIAVSPLHLFLEVSSRVPILQIPSPSPVRVSEHRAPRTSPHLFAGPARPPIFVV